MKSKRVVRSVVLRLGRNSADTLGGFFGRVADLFSRSGEEFSMVNGAGKLRVFEPMIMLMSDVATRTRVPVAEFLKLRRLSDEIPAVSDRFDFFLNGFSALVGALGDRSFGVPVDGTVLGRGFFQTYFREVGYAVYSAAGFLVAISDLESVFLSISETRRDRARHMVLYGERALDQVGVDDWELAHLFERGDEMAAGAVSARLKELRNLRSRYEMRKRRLPGRGIVRDRVEVRSDAFNAAFEGLGLSKAVESYLESARSGSAMESKAG